MTKFGARWGIEAARCHAPPANVAEALVKNSLRCILFIRKLLLTPRDCLNLGPVAELYQSAAVAKPLNFNTLFQMCPHVEFKICDNPPMNRELSPAWSEIELLTGLLSDQTIRHMGPKTAQLYPDLLRRIHPFVVEKKLRLIF